MGWQKGGDRIVQAPRCLLRGELNRQRVVLSTEWTEVLGTEWTEVPGTEWMGVLGTKWTGQTDTAVQVQQAQDLCSSRTH